MTMPQTPVPDLSQAHSNTKLGKLFHLATLHGINPETIIQKTEQDLQDIDDELHRLFEPHKTPQPPTPAA